MGTVWKQLFSDSAFNTNIAAGVSETLSSNLNERGDFAPFNRLIVTNRDVIPIQVQLNGSTEPGQFFELEAGDFLVIDPADGIKFNYLVLKNIHAATVATADKILIKWERLEIDEERSR